MDILYKNIGYFLEKQFKTIYLFGKYQNFITNDDKKK